MDNFIFKIDDWIIFIIYLILLILSIDYLASKKKEFQLFAFYIVIAFIFQVVSYFTAIFGINNLFLFHIYPPLEFLILGYTFYKWEPEQNLKGLYQASIAIIFCIIIIFAIFLSWTEIPVPLLLIESLTLTIFSSRAIFTHKNKTIFLLSFGILLFFCQNALAYYHFSISQSFIPIIQLKYVEIITNTIFVIGMVYERK